MVENSFCSSSLAERKMGESSGANTKNSPSARVVSTEESQWSSDTKSLIELAKSKMGESSDANTKSSPSATVVSVEEPQWLSNTKNFIEKVGAAANLPQQAQNHNFSTDLIRSLLKVDRVEPGRVICFFTVEPTVTQPYNSLHGGAVAAIAELVALACVWTVTGTTEVFLGEFAISYISAARQNTQVEVEGYIIRNGRSVIVCGVDFKMKETKKIVYQVRATFYNMPISKL